MLIPECCGKPVTTPFCPFCGTPKHSGVFGDLASLLKHLRAHAIRLRNEAEQVTHRRVSNPVKARASYDKAALKWERWANAVEVAVQRMMSDLPLAAQQLETTDAGSNPPSR